MKPLARDFVETHEGLVFAVVTSSFQDDLVLGFLRYIPSAKGLRKVGTDEANAFLRKHHPRYLHHCKRRDAHLHAIPAHAVAVHHRPRERLTALRQRHPVDEVEAGLHRLVGLLVAEGIDASAIGVTGSVLIGGQHPASDLDLVVYERETFLRLRAAVLRLMADGRLHSLNDGDWLDAYSRRGCALTLDEFLRHERRKGNKGMVDGRKFDIALVTESAHAEPETGWTKQGQCRIEARIADDRHAFDHPARYGLDHPEIVELYSFTHTYVGQAFSGERVEAEGYLEVAPDGRKRLIVGSSREAPGEYLRVLWEER